MTGLVADATKLTEDSCWLYRRYLVRAALCHLQITSHVPLMFN